jgi:hypothetical protein
MPYRLEFINHINAAGLFRSYQVAVHGFVPITLGVTRPKPATTRRRCTSIKMRLWREAGGDHGDLHRLFLKQRHAKRLAEHLFKRERRKNHRPCLHGVGTAPGGA